MLRLKQFFEFNRRHRGESQMMIMPTGHATFAKHLNIIVTKVLTFGGNIRDKGGIFLDPDYARMPVITLASIFCGFKNFLFSIIVKPLKYSYHVDISKQSKLLNSTLGFYSSIYKSRIKLLWSIFVPLAFYCWVSSKEYIISFQHSLQMPLMCWRDLECT
ncbi:hypothetical protein A3K79_00685 [Candidatus Bathyarchaeota archaeon RBG_13_46_16b]|nr:MAG: hypothetical protein A3K79_00685 [Candidatus Bathyarchaeota archaeon RBG_13_46_16b]